MKRSLSTSKDSSDDYGQGGFLLVEEGQVFISRYKAVKKLGQGAFGQVWQCLDYHESSFVAIKFIRADESDTAKKEIMILKRINKCDVNKPGHNKVIQYLNEFKISSTNGDHQAIVLELLNCNLFDYMNRRRNQEIPLATIKSIARQILLGLHYLHNECKCIHTDIKPENLMVCYDQETITNMVKKAKELTSVSLKLADKKKYKIKPQQEFKKMKTEAEQQTKDLNEKKHKQLKENPFENHLTQGNSEEKIDNNTDESNVINQITPLQTGSNTDVCVTSKVADEPIPEATIIQQVTDDKSCCEGKQDILHSDSEGKWLEESQEKQSPGSSLQQSPVSPDNSSQCHSGPDVNQSDAISEVEVKIGDLGNACWINQHFAEDIQTREYRSVEVLLGAGYGTSADIWSTGCTLFELVTGELLFVVDSEDDVPLKEIHLAEIIELLGPIPEHVLMEGKHYPDLFINKDELRHITGLRHTSLLDLLVETYEWDHSDASQFSAFLLRMLDLDPRTRATAADCLQHPWLN